MGVILLESTNQTETRLTPIAQIINSSTSTIIQALNTDELNQKREQYRKEQEEHRKQLHLQEVHRLLTKSAMPSRYINKNTSDYIITNTNKQALNALNNSANSFYIYGDCGSGKTFLSCLIAKESILNNPAPVLFFTATNLIYVLNPYKSNLVEEDKQHQYSRHQIYNCGVLIIDDLGVENSNSFNQSILFDIINHRYNEDLQTIFTSNFTIIDLQRRLNSYEGGRIGRRITEMCKPIFLKHFLK